MKAADARRHGSIQRKRIRLTDASDPLDDTRFYLAQRLLSAVDADQDAIEPQQLALECMRLVSQHQAELETLEQLKQWSEAFTSLQMAWVDCGSRVDSAAAVRIWDRFHSLICSTISHPERALQLDKLRIELPKLTSAAIGCVKKSYAKTLADEPTTKPLNQLDRRDTILDEIELTHQWIPPVFARIAKTVERHAAASRCRPALVDAVKRIQAVIAHKNPYAFLCVLYQPPPESLNQSLQEWDLQGSPFVYDVAQLLQDNVDAIDRMCKWMNAPDDTFWKTVAQFAILLRRFAVAFHLVMLHLYAIAMKREDPSTTATSIATEIQVAIKKHTSYRLHGRYRLSNWMRQADDPVIRESYTMYPEVLVFVDEWRREVSYYEYGFEPVERAYDYDIGVNRRRSTKVWRDMTYHTHRIVQLWHKTGLASRDFKRIDFEELGKLEKGIKHRLVEITDILYKQNLAKWMAFRTNHAQARVVGELKILRHQGGYQSGSMLRRISKSLSKWHEGSSPLKFHQPILGMPVCAQACIHTSEAPVLCPIKEDAILKWTDNEIDTHEQHTERVHDLQTRMLTSSDALNLPRIIHEPASSRDKTYEIDPETTIAGLLTAYRRLRTVAHDAVIHGEEIALHSAAEALIQRPSLRINTSVPHREPSLVEQDASIREDARNVQELLAVAKSSGTKDELLTPAHTLLKLANTHTLHCI